MSELISKTLFQAKLWFPNLFPILHTQTQSYYCIFFFIWRVWWDFDNCIWRIFLPQLPSALPSQCWVLLEHKNQPGQPASPLLLWFPLGVKLYLLFWLLGSEYCISQCTQYVLCQNSSCSKYTVIKKNLLGYLLPQRRIRQ